MTAFDGSPVRKILAMTALLAAVPLLPGRAADVTLFEKVPSVDELRNALKGQTSMGLSRSIVINQDADSTAGGPQAAPASTMAVVGQTAAPAPRGTRGQSVGLPIEFAYDSAEIRLASQPFLDQIAALMRQDHDLSLLVEGHTDSSGAELYNDTLSWKRAQAVKAYLTNQHGIPAARLKAAGVGERMPLLGTSPDDPRNRRVQFYELDPRG
jgi:outer membrane protein OmpA-like peptidoglycan-associated protein